MREHMGLYRGKRLDNGEWVEGNLVKSITETVWIFTYDYGETLQTIMPPVDPDTVGECTGLRDKNGKLIFEGDIAEHHVQKDILVNRGVVIWDAANGRWAHKLNTMTPCFYMHNPAAFEIIGTIHDNPELLEGGEG